ncbi:AI-2E family transporter [Cesiribacter sp. SM1]|uniref:AI-2E family transporter n=1 Tax=Cesiribacter sp. SM1 TaxID=2861196 RepID=UPI001CD58E9B|nr:AI-2E family transporter [Cesiribacter sp. SM1]
MRYFNPKLELIKSSLVVLLIVIALLGLATWLFSNILVYLIISLVLATLLRPLVVSISRVQLWGIRLPRGMAILSSYLVVVLVLVLFVGQFIPLISDQVEVLGSMDFDKLYTQATEPLLRFEEFLRRYDLTQREPGFMVNSLRRYINNIFSHLDVQQLINSVIGFTGSLFIGVMAVLFITYFLLQEKGLLRRNLISLIPNPYFEVSIAAVYKIEKLLSNYLLALFFQMFAVFSIASLGLSLLGIKYALTIGVFAAVANLIPYAGPILGAAFGIVVAISTTQILPGINEYLFLIAKIAAVFGTVQLIDNIIIQPLIFSKSVKAHPLEIFLVIFAGASLGDQLGSTIIGMILAVPVYTIIRVSFLEFYMGYSKYQVFRNPHDQKQRQ